MPVQHNIEYKQSWHYLINFAVTFEEVKFIDPEIISKDDYEKLEIE